MAITPARQRNAVSEGMALGLIMRGRAALPWDKVSIDLSFEGAWRSWQHRRRFPQVETDIQHGLDAVWAMTHADEGKQALGFYWDTAGPEITVCLRPVWYGGQADIDRAAKRIDDDVPAEGWRELAGTFSRAQASEPSAGMWV